LMILVYINTEFYYSDVLSYNKFKNLLTTSLRNQLHDIVIVSDLNYFETTSASFKIAVLYSPFIDNLLNSNSIDTINHFSNISNLVFVIENELFHSWQESHRFQSNVYVILPGMPGGHVKNLIIRPHWLQYLSDLYTLLPEKLAELRPYQAKEKFFDALLGHPREHRTFVYDNIKQYNLENYFITSYKPNSKFNRDAFYADDYFIWEPEIEQIDNDPVRYTSNHVKYCGIKCILSAILPVSVYNQSAYSIVTESNAVNPDTFFTEKIAKPILARRLFVVFANYQYLHNLKSLGFKTFDAIIDESYDNTYFNELRWSRAFDQVKKLCQLDQQQVLSAIQPIVEHNYRVLTETNWDQNTIDKILTISESQYHDNISI
jgi:hypothetical protein